MITKKKVLTGIAGVLLVAATAGYGAAAYYYSSHFYSHTEINGIDYGEMTVAQVKKKIADQIPSYQITIEERNGGLRRGLLHAGKQGRGRRHPRQHPPARTV